MPIPMAEERKRELVETENVTLNGVPARIGGWRCDFATVTQWPAGLSAEFAWQTVEHVVNNREGKFNA
jgi:hypothetical protein